MISLSVWRSGLVAETRSASYSSSWIHLQNAASSMSMVWNTELQPCMFARRSPAVWFVLTHVCVLFLSCSQREANSGPRQWNSHDQPSSVAALPGKETLLLMNLRRCLGIQSCRDVSVHSCFYVSSHVCMPFTSSCVHHLSNCILNPHHVPFPWGFGMFLTFIHPIYPPSLLFVSSSCPHYMCLLKLCSWGRCGWWSHAGRWHAPTCSALTPHSTSRWMRRSPPGCVLSATRRPPMNT